VAPPPRRSSCRSAAAEHPADRDDGQRRRVGARRCRHRHRWVHPAAMVCHCVSQRIDPTPRGSPLLPVDPFGGAVGGISVALVALRGVPRVTGTPPGRGGSGRRDVACSPIPDGSGRGVPARPCSQASSFSPSGCSASASPAVDPNTPP
jgi:hypothetical protein